MIRSQSKTNHLTPKKRMQRKLTNTQRKKFLLQAFLFMLALSLSSTASAQIVRDFSSRFSRSTPGDIVLTGNSVLTCPAGSAGCSDVQIGVTSTGDAANNNSHDMVYVDTDNDATTFNSSTALVNLPQNARVLWAGLYWGGRTRTGSNGTGAAAPDSSLKNTVRLRSPLTNGYITVTASTCDDATGVGNDALTGQVYQCLSEVTNQVPSTGNGSYTVANVQTGTGQNRFGGWGLVIVYEDPSQPLRNLVVYDGFGLVLDQNMSGSVNINLSGFRSPASGNVITRVGAIAYEGDQGAGGDSFRLNGVAISDTANEQDNFFNARITRLGSSITQRSPSYFNNLGFDLKLVEVVNLLANNSTNAVLKLDTSGDNYFPGVVTFGTVLYAPEMVVTKTAEDINGSPVTVGDELLYTITVTNEGGDDATNVTLEDIIPAGTTYVNNSGQVNGVSYSDAQDGDLWFFDSITNSITVNLGTGATGSTAGTVGQNSTYTVTFRVRIDDDLMEGDMIENQAVISYITATLNVPSTSISDGDINSPGADTTVTVVEFVPREINIVAPEEGDKTLQKRPTISGTATPNQTIVITINGMTFTTTSDAQGNWSYTPSSDLASGEVTVTATVEDSTAMDSVTFEVVDSGVEIITPANGEITQDDTPTITGQATPGTTVEIVIDGGAPISVEVGEDGTWSYTPGESLGEGEHTIVVTIPGTDAMDSTTFTVSNDMVTITTPADGSMTAERQPEISGTAKPNSTVSVSINGGAATEVTADADGNWSFTPGSELPIGENSVTATQGTASDQTTFTIINDGGNNGNNGNNGNGGDTITITIDSPSNNADTDTTPTITGTTEPGATVVIVIDGETIGTTVADEGGNWSFTPDEPIAEGEHTIEANADLNGKTGTSTPVIINAVAATDNRIVRGGACAVVAPGSSHQGGDKLPLLLGFLAIFGIGLFRANRKKKQLSKASKVAQVGALVATTVAMQSTAQAQSDTSKTAFQVEHFEPLTSQPLNILNIATSSTLPHLKPSFGFVSHWVNDPIQFSNPDGSNADKVIRNQIKAELNASIGLFNRAELGLVAPLVLYQNGDDLVDFGRPNEQVDGFSFADMRVIPKLSIFSHEDAGGFGLAALVPVYIPVGDEGSFNSDGKVRVEPRLVADWRSKAEGGVHISANLAYQLLRNTEDVSNFNGSDIFRWGLGARIATPVERLDVLGSVFGHMSFEEANQISGVDPSELNKSRPIELLGALEYGFTSSLFASAGAGAGVTSGVGSPDFRILLGLNYAPAPPEEPEPIKDLDGDGILDDVDQCPSEPEDIDQFEDEDGCPDPDNDQDTILDVDDQCPMDPEDIDQFEDEDGCPDPDNDQDTILDINDQCPLEKEDFDNFEDEDGCPDPDNDQDKILDVDDQCPMEPELYNGVNDEDGCPEKDTDKDGIIDPLDKCPEEPETYNGVDDDDGCPDGKQTVVLTTTEIKILEKVFFDTNKDTIKKVSYKLLNTVAVVLKQNPQITKIRIDGHTDDMGKDEYNLDLSKRRAKAVREYLVEQGVDADRLQSEGYGEEKPLCTDIPDKQLGKRSRKKAIKDCRADNRRVEFKIIELNNKPVEATTSVKVK